MFQIIPNSCEEKLLEWLNKREEPLIFTIVLKADISFKTEKIRSAIFTLLDMGKIEFVDDFKIIAKKN